MDSGTAEPIFKWGIIIEAAQYVGENQFKVAQNAHGRKSAGAKVPLAPSPRLHGFWALRGLTKIIRSIRSFPAITIRLWTRHGRL